MVEGNVYKPRYKVAFQSKSKIWAYKSCRLRRFFNIRGWKIVRRGYFKRYVIVLNNMKWTVARRYIRPAMRRRKAIRRRFRDYFYNKQKLRLVYGKFKEQEFRRFFRRHLINTLNLKKSFFAALERRIDIFFFRMRLLPTIFACYQYIQYYGILINNKAEHSPNALLNVSDVVSIRENHWESLFCYFKERLFYRVLGNIYLTRRNYKLLKKKTLWLRRRLRRSSWLFKLKKKLLYIYISILKKRKQFLSTFRRKFKRFWMRFNFLITSLHKKERLPFLISKFYFILNMYISFFILQRKYKKLVRKRVRSFFKFPKFPKFFKYKYRTKRYLRINTKRIKRIKRKIYLKLMVFLGFIFTNYLKISQLCTTIKVEELELHSFLLSCIKRTLEINKAKAYLRLKIRDFKRVVKTDLKILIEDFAILRIKIIKFYSFFLRRLIRKQISRSFYKYIPKLKSYTPRGNILSYFLVKRNRKHKRRLRVKRLKVVHWALPSYIYVDFITLRGVLLYYPMYSQIHYSFKCSLTKITAFYKSLAL